MEIRYFQTELNGLDALGAPETASRVAFVFPSSVTHLVALPGFSICVLPQPLLMLSGEVGA